VELGFILRKSRDQRFCVRRATLRHPLQTCVRSSGVSMVLIAFSAPSRSAQWRKIDDRISAGRIREGRNKEVTSCSVIAGVI